MSDLESTLAALFDAERAVRAAHDTLAQSEARRILPLLKEATHRALRFEGLDEDESSLRLVRIAELLGVMEGPLVVDLLVDILGCEDPEVRRAAGEALQGLAFDRFKEVALGVERAFQRLPAGSAALAELPYLLAEIPEPGVAKLLARFLQNGDADAVAAAIEVLVEIGDPAAVPLLDALASDPRRVQLEDEGGTEGEATIGELVAEARILLSKGAA
ncbi:MAG TPA: HEAT repeat domain-containing protein [Polyangiaceae bacterium]|nr:HEAT repeat domain-containing protein [Polyangiaceae bacterium]